VLDRWMREAHGHRLLRSKIESLFGVRLNRVQLQAISLIEGTEKSIIVSAPTGSGKTLVGYAALLHHGRGFYLAPLISVMFEKYRELKRLSRYTVAVSNRDYRVPAPRFLSADIKVMSPYKFLALSREIDPDRHGRIVVFDEVHKVSGDPLFEAALARAREMGMRVVALSATIPDDDLELLARYLDAEVVKATERPVELRHYPIRLHQAGSLVYSSTEYRTSDGITLVSPSETFRDRYEAAAAVAARLYQAYKAPVIVWAPTRGLVERVAATIAAQLPASEEHAKAAEELPAGNASERVLRETAARGVFIHHGGLSYTVRNKVIELYKRLGGVMVTAYTLSHGVNIPGRFLVISSLYDYKGRVLDANTFHQIAGRAGRPGLDNVGIVITITAGEAESAYYDRLVARRASGLDPALLRDPVAPVKYALPRAGYACDCEAARRALRETFSYAKTRDDAAVEAALERVREAIEYYQVVGGRAARVAVEMGLHPLEHQMISTVLAGGGYRETLAQLLPFAMELVGVDRPDAAQDVMNYGYLATWMGSTPAARELASVIQNVVETGSYYAGRVYGWGSPEWRRVASFAKKYAYAGSPALEAAARTVRVDTLRRMIKAAPQLVLGVRDRGEAEKAVLAAVTAAFPEPAPPDRVARLLRTLWSALTGDDAPPGELVRRALEVAGHEG